jgi:hypothetical protein
MAHKVQNLTEFVGAAVYYESTETAQRHLSHKVCVPLSNRLLWSPPTPLGRAPLPDQLSDFRVCHVPPKERGLGDEKM